MSTEKAIASSGSVTEIAARNLGISRHVLAAGLSVSVPLNTHVLEITCTSTDPAIAQRWATALAAAYVEYSGSARAAATDSTSSAATVKATIITAADRPASQSSPNHLLDLAVGITVGLLLGIGVALLRDRLDDRLRGVVDLEERIGAPLLAQLPAVRRRRRDAAALLMLRAPKSPAAKAYRDLHVRVVRAAARRSAKTVLVTCPLSEGKSHVAANLAISLAQAGWRTVLVCADASSPRTEALFALGDDEDRRPVVINTRTDLSKVVRYTAVDGLLVLPTSCIESSFDLHASTFPWALDELSRTADFVIADAPPLLLGATAGALAESVDAVLVVADARRSTRRRVDSAARQLEHIRSNVIGCVLDNVGRRRRLPKPARVLAHRDAREGEPTYEIEFGMHSTPTVTALRKRRNSQGVESLSAGAHEYAAPATEGGDQ
jgi:succinoglycan biosynthesis transport protein ExoP